MKYDGITIGDDTFIGQYLKYMNAQETPTVYDFFCACWCLSIAVGRECYVARPKAPVRLNMYCILSSDSGVTRKSTSVRIATNIVRDYIRNSSSKLTLIESKITTGLLERRLYEDTKRHGYSHIAISASELAAVLSRSGGLSGMPALLTDLYDCPDSRSGGGTISFGVGIQENIYASFIGASTPSWLGRAVTPAIIEGGFTSRCYFIDGSSRKQSVAWPEERDDETTRRILTDTLTQIGKTSSSSVRQVEVSSAAIRHFSAWYNDRQLHRDAYRESFEAREDAHVLRFAAYLSINDSRWYVSADDISNAIKIVRRIKLDGMRLFSGTTVEKKDVRLIEKLKAHLISAGTAGTSQSEILRAMRPAYKSEQIRSVLSVMHELDLVQKFSVPSEGRDRTVWRATIYLSNDELYSQVANKLGISNEPNA